MFYFLIVLFVFSSTATASTKTEAAKLIKRQQNNDNRIIGGQPIPIRDAPYQVALFVENEFSCGGSILTKRFILTAAHCLVDYKASDIKIRAGSANREYGGQVRQVIQIIFHADYNAQTMNNDIGIMKLLFGLNFNANVAPVKLATDYQPSSGFATVSGWGVQREDALNVANTLRAVTVRFVTLNKCKQEYRGTSAITANMVCAGATNGGKDACQGDSGGPLVYNGTQYGIVSFGEGCARKAFSGVYTSVERKRPWIKKVLMKY